MTTSSFSIVRPQFGKFLAISFVALTIAGCNTSLPPPCPPVRVDSTTGIMTKFRDGAGQDLSGVEYEVEIVGFRGECVIEPNEEVAVILDVDFEITSGPAAQAGPATFYYFAAIPQFYPQDSGKKIFEVSRRLQGGATAPILHKEENVRIEVPLKEKQPAASFDIYIGLQLSDSQLEFNRQRMQR